MEIITDEELASYLGTEVTSGLTLVTELVNELITEAWVSPTEPPAPARVRSLAFTVGARALANPKGLTSWTRSWDDITRTERMEGGDRRLGVYLTDEELADLNGSLTPFPASVGTIHTPLARERCKPC